MKDTISVLVYSLIFCQLLVGSDKRGEILRAEYSGVPWESCQQLGSMSVEYLKIVIAKEHASPNVKTNAVICLGVVGAAKDFEALVVFLERDTGLLSIEEYDAKSSVPLALGILASRTQDDSIVKYLSVGLRQSYWRSKIRWVSPNHKSPDALSLYLARACMQALGLAASDSAVSAIVEFEEKVCGKACPLQDVISDAKRTCQRVRGLDGGVSAYFGFKKPKP